MHNRFLHQGCSSRPLTAKRFFQLFVPGTHIQICRRRRVSIVGKPIIAVVEVTARITEANQVACAMRDVSVVRKTVAENDDLSKCRRLRVNENWSHQRNGPAQYYCYSIDYHYLQHTV